MRALFAFAAILLAGQTLAADDIDAKVEAALAAEARPEPHRERDRNRRPAAR